MERLRAWGLWDLGVGFWVVGLKLMQERLQRDADARPRKSGAATRRVSM